MLPDEMAISIFRGKLKGKKLFVKSGSIRYILGIYEPNKAKLFEKFIQRGKVFYDIGAHIGYFTLMASLLVGESGKVISFEPNPQNIGYLRKHMKINNRNNVTIIEAAVSSKNGVAFFDNDKPSIRGHLSPNGKLKVKTISIDSLIKFIELPPPNFIKIDAQGAELQVLKGAKQTLLEYDPILFFATHSGKLHNDCICFLESIGYNVIPETGNDLHATNQLIAHKKYPRYASELG
jgi:FkbM family methyltransferase